MYGKFGITRLDYDSWMEKIRESELRAYDNVLLNPEKRDFSPEYIEKVKTKRKSYFFVGSMWDFVSEM